MVSHDMNIPQLTYLLSYWWTPGFSYEPSGTGPFGGHMHTFLLFMYHSGTAGSHGMHLFYVSIHCEALSEVTIPISTATGRMNIWVPVASYCPKTYFKRNHKEGQEVPKGHKEKQGISWNHQLSEIWTGSQCWSEGQANTDSLGILRDGV